MNAKNFKRRTSVSFFQHDQHSKKRLKLAQKLQVVSLVLGKGLKVQRDTKDMINIRALTSTSECENIISYILYF